MSDTRPNVLLISTDQHRADHLGCYGARVLQTPNIDALALSGTRYENAYVASPVCMPNRASLMTGRMPSLHGVRHNGIDLELGTVTFAEVLRRSGWRTSLAGKPHFQCVTQNPAKLNSGSGDRPVLEARGRLSGRYDQEIGRLWRDCPDHDLDLPYYGFQAVDLAVGHGDQVDGHYTRWLKGQGVDPDALRGPANALSGAPRDTLQAWRTAVPEDLYPTRYVQTKTIDRLKSFAEDKRTPFFHWASFCDPHHPFTPPGRYWDMYRPQDVELPPSFNAPGGSDLIGDLHALRRDDRADLGGTGAIAVSEDELRAALALTYGMIAMIDDAVGEIMSALRVLGLADNTIVIFLSDHGDLMGDRGLMFKGPYHYRGLIRTPLIWADPRSAGGNTVDAPVSTIDIPASILETAALDPFNGMQGIPFVDRNGHSTTSRDSVLIEDEIQAAIPGQSVRGRVRTLLCGGWRLTIYDGLDQGELYNINEDPLELRNVWSDPAAAAMRAEMTEKMLRRMIAHSETSPLPHFAA